MRITKEKKNPKEPKKQMGQYFMKAYVYSPSRWKIQAWHKCQLQGKINSVLAVVIVMHPS